MRFSKPKRPMRIMEICGTHTMSIAKAGIKSLLPEGLQLISGPGCPVCVTPSSLIDDIIQLLDTHPNLWICSYGDMLRIPGSSGQTLRNHERVQLCLSCMDACRLAKEHPELDILFLGVGFETTTPGSAVLVQEAHRQNLKNLYFYSALKRTEPAIRALLEKSDTQIDGFLCPGHVAAIIGEDGFQFLCQDYHKPGVICGFEPEDILCSIEKLIQMINQNQAEIQNTYTRVVEPQGNVNALKTIDQVFEPVDSLWRGLGWIPNSGYALQEKYAYLDAQKHFHLLPLTNKEPKNCACAQILCGQKSPKQCPLFKTVCTPQHPIGPCMVSSEGGCAAAYAYE